MASNAALFSALGDTAVQSHAIGVFVQRAVFQEIRPEPVPVVLVISGFAPEHMFRCHPGQGWRRICSHFDGDPYGPRIGFAGADTVIFDGYSYFGRQVTPLAKLLP